MGIWAEYKAFYRQFRERYQTTGSITPSSRGLARALTAPIRKSAPPRRILEVGPGTGAVTVAILKELQPGDSLDIVEINDQFVAYLQNRFDSEPLWQEKRHQARLIHAPLQEVPGTDEYDFMVSGLPLNNFPLRLIRDIFQCYERLLKPEGVLSYFEYLGIRVLKSPFVGKRGRRRLRVLDRVFGRRIAAHQIGERRVYMNVPPAVARYFSFTR